MPVGDLTGSSLMHRTKKKGQVYGPRAGTDEFTGR